MTEKKRDEVRRTLIITCGSIAQAAGEQFNRHMETRCGPAAAVKALHIEAGWQETDLTTAVSTMLTNISPPNLANLLAEEGWGLHNEAVIYLIFVVDAVSEGEEKLAAFMHELTTIAYTHLGLEPATLLIWLVGDCAVEDVTACLTLPTAATRGTAVLSLRNESGMRLPDEAALSEIASETLWCLTATSLQMLPEQIQERSGINFTGDTTLFSLGLHGWAWSPDRVQTAFVQRWLESVLAFWTADAADEEEGIEAVIWLNTNRLSAEAFAQWALSAEERQPPNFAVIERKMPPPWKLQTLWGDLRFMEAVDGEALVVYRKQTCLRLEEPLREGSALVQNEVKRMMDEWPIAAISRACLWLQNLMDECDRQIEQTLDQAETLENTVMILAGERQTVEIKIRHLLGNWPRDEWSSWLRAAAKPWRWPRLLWQYWQLQLALTQMGIILTQQADLQRRILQNKTAWQGLSELIPCLRGIYNRVEEVGDMLSALAEELAEMPHIEKKLIQEGISLSLLAVPHQLYERLVPDEATEAVAAARAIGGLGQQVTALDDTIEKPLTYFGRERLVGIWQIGCATALMTLLPVDEWISHCRFAWEAACPMWRMDEARLNESYRTQASRFTAVCGADLQDFASWLPDGDGSIQQMQTSNREYLWLVRVRTDLVLETGQLRKLETGN